eukprot:NODE_705_length_4578_cov_0.471087.p1 type:complete len:455 gc:universal NODE_705_length_4578_cov_0.471087:3258-1894(-)
MILNPITFYYLDPTDLHKTIKEFDDEYYQEITKYETKIDKFDNEAKYLIEQAMKIEHGEPLSTVDLYALIDCPDRSKTNKDEMLVKYKSMILKYHPDKCGHLGVKDEMFKGIQLAYDILTDPKARKSYDSMDLKNPIHLPIPQEYMDGDVLNESKFYKVFEQYFNDLSHYGEKKMPLFSEIKDEKVNLFYNQWLKYKSWRTFDLDSLMELKSTSGGRDERRHRQKELAKAWELKRREFAVETSNMIQLAMKLDPRCVKLQESEMAEKQRKKDELKQKKLELIMKRNGGKLPNTPNSNKSTPKTSRPTSAPSTDEPWTSAELAALLDGTKKIPGGTRERFERIADHVQKQCKTDHLRTKAQVIEQMKAIKNGNLQSLKEMQTKVEKSGDQSEATVNYDRQMTWTTEQQKSLENAMKKYADKSDVKRWEKISKEIGISEADCKDRVKQVKENLKKK